MLLIGVALAATAVIADDSVDFFPCSPASDFRMENAGPVSEDLEFCSDWNPEFKFNGHHCCAKFIRGRRRSRRANLCSPSRRTGNHCGEMTDDQRRYQALASSGKLGDLLPYLKHEIGQRGEQSYCTVNNGFLAWGRELIPTKENRIHLRTPERCVDFGTDRMIGMLEWVGHQVARKYPESRIHLIIGDISAPRGGCLSGHSGRRGHSSHTTGQDVDVGYLTIPSSGDSPERFHKKFDAKTNAWLIQRFFKNPFVCVKTIFLDRHNIWKLARLARRGDGPDGGPKGWAEEWETYRHLIHHVPGHRNHFHVRIGEGPGPAGCAMMANGMGQEEE